MELNNFEIGGRGAAGGKGEEAGGDSSNRKTVVKFVVRWTVFQKRIGWVWCTIDIPFVLLVHARRTTACGKDAADLPFDSFDHRLELKFFYSQSHNDRY